MAFTLDTTVGQLVDDPQAKAVLEQYIPGFTTNPMLMMVKGMTVNMLLALPQAAQFGLTKEKAQAIIDEVNKRI